MVESTQCLECLEERNALFREDKEESILKVRTKKEKKEKSRLAREYERSQYLADDDFRVYVDEDQYEDICFLPQTAEEAIAIGEKFYFTGKPCRRGHLAKRIARGNNHCYVCEKANRRKDAVLHPEDWEFKLKAEKLYEKDIFYDRNM